MSTYIELHTRTHLIMSRHLLFDHWSNHDRFSRRWCTIQRWQCMDQRVMGQRREGSRTHEPLVTQRWSMHCRLVSYVHVVPCGAFDCSRYKIDWRKVEKNSTFDLIIYRHTIWFKSCVDVLLYFVPISGILSPNSDMYASIADDRGQTELWQLELLKVNSESFQFLLTICLN